MDRICRVCLTENTNLTPIFQSTQDLNQTDLSQKIRICGAVEIHEQDGLPTLICDVCIYKASVAHEFRQLCQQSDARLRLCFNKTTYNDLDPGVQNNLEDQVLISKAAVVMDNNYFVKDEQYHNQLATGHFNSVVSETTNINDVNIVNATLSAEEQKLYECHLGFDETNVDKVNECNMPSVDCLDQQITSLEASSDSIMDQVCAVGSVVDEIKHEESYFNQIKNEQSAHLQGAGNQIVPNQISICDSTTLQNDSIDQLNNITKDNSYEPENTAKGTDENYRCNVCLKEYTTKKSLKKHSLLHEKKYKCDVCLKVFFKSENLEKHKAVHEAKPFACKICHASFSKDYNLFKHLESHSDNVEKDRTEDENNGIICEFDVHDIKNDFDSDFDLDKEIDEFKNIPKLYKCKICSQYCSSLKNLKRHSLIHGEKKLSCTVCKKWFYRPDMLKKHAEKHGHGLLDNLEDTNNLFDSDEEMSKPTDSKKRSKRRKNENEEIQGEYKCIHCEKILATKKGLRRHIAMHKPKPEPVVCEICNKVCASRARLKLHEKTHEKPKEKVPREYLCHICSKVYPSNSSLTYHMRTHSGIKPHVCKICNSGFTTTTSLANHIRIHTGDKPFVCHVCSAAFAVSSAFRRHLTRHTGEANYICKTCGKAFKRLSTLKEHTYTHSGEKPYVCKTCGAAYSHSGSLFAHQKRCKTQQLSNSPSIPENEPLTHHIYINNGQILQFDQ